MSYGDIINKCPRGCNRIRPRHPGPCVPCIYFQVGDIVKIVYSSDDSLYRERGALVRLTGLVQNSIYAGGGMSGSTLFRGEYLSDDVLVPDVYASCIDHVADQNSAQWFLLKERWKDEPIQT